MSAREAEGRLQVLQIYRLLQWVHEGDRAQIKKMVKLGVENLLNLTAPQDGVGVLHVAVSANNHDLVSFLLSQGAHPDVQDKQGRTPVMLAAELGNDAIVTLLAQSEADLRLRDIEGKGVLFYCICPTKRHSRCLQVALENQADVNNVSAQGIHVFQEMCEKAQDCPSLCFSMLEGGADPNATNQKSGVTALMEAAKAGSLQLVRAILQKGGNPNIIDRKRFTAVHYAAMGGFFELIQLLSAYSADMSIINMEDCTALHYAAATGNTSCCKFLAQRGCNAKVKNQDGLLARQIAKEAGHKAAAKELRKAERKGKGSKSSDGGPMSDLWGLTLHDWSHEFETQLRQAFGKDSETNPETFISVLQELKAPVTLEQLNTVIAAHSQEIERIERTDSDSETQEIEGIDTIVSINDFIKGVKYIKKPFLLSAYMPKKKKGEKGGKGGKRKGKFVLPMPICTLPPELMPRRPDGGPPHFMIETYYNTSDIRRFDRDHPPAHPVMNDSAWYMDKPPKVFVNVNHCVRSGDLESLDLALNRGLSVDARDEFYKTPLMVACSNGNYEMVQYLLGRGANVNLCDQFFWTPLHHAAHAGQLEIIELLVEAGANKDAEALCGGTPLMRAIQSSRPACVDFLINAGADVRAENKKEQTCLEVAMAFGDSRTIALIEDKLESLPPAKETKGKGGKGGKSPKPAKGKVFTVDSAALTETSTATAGKTSPPKDSKSVILQNTRITTGKTDSVDITFVPKSVWGKPPTTSQLMSKIEKRKEPLSLEVDFDDFMMPFSQNVQRKTLELANTTE